MSHQATERRGGTFNAYGQVKEGSLKRPHTVGLQLCDVLEKQNWRQQKDLWLPGWWWVGRDEQAEPRVLEQ